MSTMLMFAIVQGLYILRQDEGDINGRKTEQTEEIETFQ